MGFLFKSNQEKPNYIAPNHHRTTHFCLPSSSPPTQKREFAMQQALSAYWKGLYPTLRFLTYRILSAVPYDMVIQVRNRCEHCTGGNT